jgi:hypothetical protein
MAQVPAEFTNLYAELPTNSLRAQYIEVFPLDVLAFPNVIGVAHQELFTPP